MAHDGPEQDTETRGYGSAADGPLTPAAPLREGPAIPHPPAVMPASAGPSWLWAKIKRHKVVEWTLAYIAFAYAFLHGAEMLSDAQEWPHAIVHLISLALILGVPMVSTLAWYHGHSAQHRIHDGTTREVYRCAAVCGHEREARNGVKARVLGHRQTKGAATDNLNLQLPRHISTLRMVDSDMKSRHTANGVLKQTGPHNRF